MYIGTLCHVICLQGDSLCSGTKQEGPRSEVLLHGLLHSFLSKDEIQGKHNGNILVHCGLLCLHFPVSFYGDNTTYQIKYHYSPFYSDSDVTLSIPIVII